MMRLLGLMLMMMGFTAQARQGYSVESVNAQANGRLCIVERAVNSSGSFINCSTDVISKADADQLNLQIESFFKNKPLSIVQNFLSAQPLDKAESHLFTFAEFKKFLDAATASSSCNSTALVYQKKKAELEAKLKEVNTSLSSNEAALVRACAVGKAKSL